MDIFFNLSPRHIVYKFDYLFLFYILFFFVLPLFLSSFLFAKEIKVDEFLCSFYSCCQVNVSIIISKTFIFFSDMKKYDLSSVITQTEAQCFFSLFVMLF